jgi:hypothetical protein
VIAETAENEGAVLDQEMCVELQAARMRDQLDVVDADAAIAPFPACDRGLAEAEAFGQLALRAPESSASSWEWQLTGGG